MKKPPSAFKNAGYDDYAASHYSYRFRKYDLLFYQNFCCAHCGTGL